MKKKITQRSCFQNCLLVKWIYNIEKVICLFHTEDTQKETRLQLWKDKWVGPLRVGVVNQIASEGFLQPLGRWLDLHNIGSCLIRAIGRKVYFCDGQVSLFAEGRGLHCTWSWVSSQLHYPRVDSVCFITSEKFWGITYLIQASIVWAMNPLLSLTKGSNFLLSPKGCPILDHNTVKMAFCKQVSKSVSLPAQWGEICNSPLWITPTILWEAQSQSLLLRNSEG